MLFRSQQLKIYLLTPYECVHCTRMPHLIWSRNHCATGKGLRVFEAKIGEPVISRFGCVCWVPAQHLARQLRQDIARRSVSTRQKGNLRRRGQPARFFIFSSALSQHLMTDSTAAAVIVCLRIAGVQAQVGSRRPFQTDRFMYAGVTISVGRIIPNRLIQSSFQTSVPFVLPRSPHRNSILMERKICWP